MHRRPPEVIADFDRLLELARGGGELNQAQVGMVRKHLALVFIHEIDPAAGPPEHQAKLDAAHAPEKIGGVGPGGIAYRC